MKIFIVEDDIVIAENLKIALEKWHYDVILAQDFHNILEEIEVAQPQLLLLDIILPVFNGYYWCQKIRENSQIPIVYISSKSSDMDIVMAMQMGGDDFITKPININILLAKIQALLRRTYDFDNRLNFNKFSGIRLFPEQAKLVFGDSSLDLTLTELQIMQVLFRAQGDIVSRETIMDAAWQESNFIDDNTLSVNINRLRKKLAELGLENLINTKRGIGYYLDDAKK